MVKQESRVLVNTLFRSRTWGKVEGSIRYRTCSPGTSCLVEKLLMTYLSCYYWKRNLILTWALFPFYNFVFIFCVCVETRRRLEEVESVLHRVGSRTHTYTLRLGSLPFWAIAEPWALLLWGTRRNTSMRWEAFMEVSEEKLHSTVWVTGEHPDELKSLPSSPKGSSQQWQCLWTLPCDRFHRNPQNTVWSFLLEIVSNCIPVRIILQLSLLNSVRVSFLGKVTPA